MSMLIMWSKKFVYRRNLYFIILAAHLFGLALMTHKMNARDTFIFLFLLQFLLGNNNRTLPLSRIVNSPIWIVCHDGIHDELLDAMHRLQLLHLSTPSIAWDRKLPEYTLFERTLNRPNVEETNQFLNILEEETDAYFKYVYNNVADQFTEVPYLLNSKDSDKILKGMSLLNGIIIRSPRDSPVLPIALKLRGNCSFQKCCFEAASMDYEMFLYIGSQTNDAEELCEVNGSLVICYYLRRQYEKSKERLTMFYKYKALLPVDYFEKSILERLSRHISHFADELNNLDDIVPKFKEDVYFYIPFKGFNMSEDIPLSSAACTYAPKQGGLYSNNGVFANCTIPLGGVVLVECPIVQSVDKPFVQCEQCLQQKELVYSCLDCRYKTYCSLKCMKQDEKIHKDECIGYKYLILLILDASNLYRIFMRISILLHDKVFPLKHFRKLTTASDVWEKVQSVGVEQHIHGMQYIQFLTSEPDYCKLSKMQYSTLVVTALRLTVFIEKKTLIMESLYGKLRLSNKQKMIFIGAILLRLNCHLINNTFDFEFNYPLSAKKPNYLSMEQQVTKLADGIIPVDDMVFENIYSYHNIEVQYEVNKLRSYLHAYHIKKNSKFRLDTTEHTLSCNNIQRQLSTYKDNIAELYFNPDYEDFFLYGDAAGMPTTKTSAALICKHISEIRELERLTFVQTFARHFHLHFVEYFLQMNLRHKRIQQIITLLCTTLSKFRHSCAPNVEVVVMDNGLVVGKALKEIQKGDELLVSFKAHYMRHTLAERRQYLQKLNLECSCKYCQMDEMDDVCNQRAGIFCDKCESTKITPIQGKCMKCRTNYNTLLMRYKAKCTGIAEEIYSQMQEKGNQGDFVVRYIRFYKYASKCFVPCNEFLIRIELDYAQFLALKNFAKPSYEIIVDVKEKLLLCYEESFIWFTIYAHILNIIKVILYYNLDKNFSAISANSLEFLCKFGLHIINGQLEHIQLYETFDYECAPILQDLYTFFDWKDKILCMNLLPLVSNISKEPKNKSAEHNEKKVDPAYMPSLSKVRG